MIEGDPLTGSLPRTQLVVSPRKSKVELQTWPLKPDVDSVTLRLLKPGNIAAVRTRRGVKLLRIRVVHHSNTRRGKGRRFFIGDDRRGHCRAHWVSDIISIEEVNPYAYVRDVPRLRQGATAGA